MGCVCRIRKYQLNRSASRITCLADGIATLSPKSQSPKTCIPHLLHMGGCQNYGPFLGTLNNRCRIIIGTQKGTLFLTTTHITPLQTGTRRTSEFRTHSLAEHGRKPRHTRQSKCVYRCTGSTDNFSLGFGGLWL